MNELLTTWLAVCRPPQTALKQIGGGRLKGMTDINPQWRYKAMTEQFGIVGVGWKYRVTERWQHEDTSGQIAVFVSVALQIKLGDQWSDDIHGSGGAMLISEESKTDYETKQKSKVLYMSDEAYKMAETDALSVAMKQIGVAADIYMGMFNGSKYTRPTGDEPEPTAPKADTVAEDALYTAVCDKWLDSLVCIREALKSNDYSTAKEAWNELDADVKSALWKAPSKGGWFTTREREQMRCNEWSAA